MKKIWIYTLLLILSLSACISEIDLSTDPAGLDKLVVFGDFTDTGSAHRVRLTHPNKYGVAKSEDIIDAKVALYDDQGNKADYTPVYVVENGETALYYQMPAGVLIGEPGHSYYLNIELANGKTYRSIPQNMPLKLEADSIVVRGKVVKEVGTTGTITDERRAFVSVANTLPAQTPYYLRWDAFSVYYFREVPLNVPLPPPTRECYISEFFNKQVIATAVLSGPTGTSIENEIGSKYVDHAFESSVYFTVIQKSITPEAQRYWEQIKKIATPQGTVFDAPPGTVRGNVVNVDDPNDYALGFFEVASVDTIRRQYFNGDLGADYRVGSFCATGNPFTSGRPECTDCLIFPNSTTAKPHYWHN